MDRSSTVPSPARARRRGAGRRSTPSRSRSTATSRGYTDIARGVARLLGFELMLNFDLPYFAQTHHRVLAPLAHQPLHVAARLPLHPARRQPRAARSRTYRNLMLTMLLGGLWHGAAWNFVVWGVFHGLLLIVPSAAGRARRRARARSAAPGGRRGVDVPPRVLGWLLFRAQAFGADALTCSRASSRSRSGARLHAAALAVLLVCARRVVRRRGERIGRSWDGRRRWARPTAALLVILVLHAGQDGRSSTSSSEQQHDRGGGLWPWLLRAAGGSRGALDRVLARKPWRS